MAHLSFGDDEDSVNKIKDCSHHGLRPLLREKEGNDDMGVSGGYHTYATTRLRVSQATVTSPLGNSLLLKIQILSGEEQDLHVEKRRRDADDFDSESSKQMRKLV